jgi:peptidyl-prolyl cis-trans isomerase B (cyclophilin B)
VSSERDNRARAARRAKLEREMAARREAARRKQLLQTRIGVGAAGLVVLAAIAWIVIAAVNSPGPKQPAAATPTGCHYTVQPAASPVPTVSGSPAAAPTPTAMRVAPPATKQTTSGYRLMTINTNRGVITIEMNLSKAPCTGASMTTLAQAGYYNNSKCHRLVASIDALQCGDPTGLGTGGPGYQFADENLPAGQLPAYHPGDVAMANSGAGGTNGSQFFFVWGVSSLPGNYSLWGHVVTGMNIVSAVAAGGDDEAFASQAGGGHPKLPLVFNSVSVGPVYPTSQVTPTPSETGTPNPSATPTTTPSVTPSATKS